MQSRTKITNIQREARELFESELTLRLRLTTISCRVVPILNCVCAIYSFNMDIVAKHLFVDVVVVGVAIL